MRTFGKRVDGIGGRRHAARQQTLLGASILTLRFARRVELVDVSSTGAKLRGTQLPRKGETLVVRVGTVDTIGTAVWEDEGVCGIHFDEPLREEHVSQLRSTALATTLPNMTAEERLAAEDWFNGSAR